VSDGIVKRGAAKAVSGTSGGPRYVTDLPSPRHQRWNGRSKPYRRPWLEFTLFDEIEQLMRDRMISSTAAAKILADQERVAGIGTANSRAKRLAERYRRERECRN
jgi:hypothetical protein